MGSPDVELVAEARRGDVRLTDGQVEDVFWNNAARLFGV